MKKWEKFSDEELSLLVSLSYSFKQLAEKCGYSSNSGSGIAAVKEMCKQKGFNTFHFSNELRKEDVDIKKVFVQGYKSRETLKRNLIALRGYHCECCKLSTWNDKEIPLQVHHIDGNGLNNLLENLQLLCPNCHAQTDTYCGKNKNKKNVNDEDFIKALNESENIHQALIKIGSTDGRLYEKARSFLEKGLANLKVKEQEINYCAVCGKEIQKKSTYCAECYHKQTRQYERPPREELKSLIRTTSFVQIGKDFGVTDNTIRKWCKAENLPYKKIKINKISDDDWEKI